MPQSAFYGEHSPRGSGASLRRPPRKNARGSPPLVVLRADQSQVGLVNQCRRLERLTRVLPGSLRRQLTQLRVDQRQQLPAAARSPCPIALRMRVVSFMFAMIMFHVEIIDRCHPLPRFGLIDRSHSPRLIQVSFKCHFSLATPCAHLPRCYSGPSKFRAVSPPCGAGTSGHQQARPRRR